jgi:hypothetical protein
MRDEYKHTLGLFSAIIFWSISLFCFVFGLAFTSSFGFSFMGIDFMFYFTILLGLANTAVQIIGNDQTKEELGLVLFFAWIASYMFGIGSNVNFLYQKIMIDVPFLKFLVCGGLGAMIEIIPERLFVRYVRYIVQKNGSQPIRQKSRENMTYQAENLPAFLANQQRKRRQEGKIG